MRRAVGRDGGAVRCVVSAPGRCARDGPLQGPLQSRAADESDTFMVRGSESAEAKRTIDENFRRGSESAAIIAYFRDGGHRRPPTASGSRPTRAAICASAHDPEPEAGRHALRRWPAAATDPLDLSPGGPGLLTSSDASVALASALMTDDSTQTAEAAAATIRSIVPSPEGDETGLRAYVTGRGRLRGRPQRGGQDASTRRCCWSPAACSILLLLAIYRSPLMALVPIFVVGIAYIVAGGLTYLLVRARARRP